VFGASPHHSAGGDPINIVKLENVVIREDAREIAEALNDPARRW
jgi:hypothetical protein